MGMQGSDVLLDLEEQVMKQRHNFDNRDDGQEITKFKNDRNIYRKYD